VSQGHQWYYLIISVDGPGQPETTNKKAVAIVTRVKEKLTGRDFANETVIQVDVPKQVELLIQQATSNENLCQCYIGWYVIRLKQLMHD
jgi:FKBP12-rapamycin complex-associated protein